MTLTVALILNNLLYLQAKAKVEPCPVAICGAAHSGSGLVGVLACVCLGSLLSSGASWICGASVGVVNGASPEERVPTPEGGVSTSTLSGFSIQGL